MKSSAGTQNCCWTTAVTRTQKMCENPDYILCFSGWNEQYTNTFVTEQKLPYNIISLQNCESIQGSTVCSLKIMCVKLIFILSLDSLTQLIRVWTPDKKQNKTNITSLYWLYCWISIRTFEVSQTSESVVRKKTKECLLNNVLDLKVSVYQDTFVWDFSVSCNLFSPSVSEFDLIRHPLPPVFPLLWLTS